jgi:hypothetical protein
MMWGHNQLLIQEQKGYKKLSQYFIYDFQILSMSWSIMMGNHLEEEDNLPLLWLIIHSPLVNFLGQNLGCFEEH